MSKLYDMLNKSAQADKAKALLSLELLGNKAVSQMAKRATNKRQ